jgi:UDP-2,3-diacylglucosamine pyrophosphatase LpxH
MKYNKFHVSESNIFLNTAKKDFMEDIKRERMKILQLGDVEEMRNLQTEMKQMKNKIVAKFYN